MPALLVEATIDENGTDGAVARVVLEVFFRVGRMWFHGLYSLIR